MNRRYSKTENDWYMNKCFQIFGRDEQVKKYGSMKTSEK